MKKRHAIVKADNEKVDQDWLGVADVVCGTAHEVHTRDSRAGQQRTVVIRGVQSRGYLRVGDSYDHEVRVVQLRRGPDPRADEVIQGRLRVHPATAIDSPTLRAGSAPDGLGLPPRDK